MEEKMTERFAQEAIRSHKKHNVFDLEEEEPSEGLTHGGKPLFDTEEPIDDFDEDDLGSGDELDDSKLERRALKRLRQEEDEGSEQDSDEPERKKSKAEVMQEVIAKSKEYKFLRQAAKEEDTELRYVVLICSTLLLLDSSLWWRSRPYTTQFLAIGGWSG